MNEPELKSAAFALAEATPRHLDQPTMPPIHWRLEGDQLRVLLADGRTVRGPYKPLSLSKSVLDLGRAGVGPASPTSPSSPSRSTSYPQGIPVGRKARPSKKS